MATFNIAWEIVILGSICIALCFSVRMLYRKLMALQAESAITRTTLEKQINDLSQQVAVLSKGSMGVGKRLMVTEKRLNQTMERQEEIENKDMEKMSFSQAAKLLEKGVEINDIVERVGISRSEAKLVELFKRREMEPVD